jgi:hypothetical protein
VASRGNKSRCISKIPGSVVGDEAEGLNSSSATVASLGDGGGHDEHYNELCPQRGGCFGGRELERTLR